MTLHRKQAQKETGAERPYYGTDTSQNWLIVLAGLFWLLPQLVGQGDWWQVVLALIVGGGVVWGGITTAIGSMSWYRIGLDRKLIEVSSVSGTCKALNACCGTGSLAVAFGKTIRSGEVFATDTWKPTKRMPDPAKRARDNVRLEGVDHIVQVQEADPLALPFKAGRFNVVGTRFGVSNARKHRTQTVMEMLRVLKPGGCLVLAEGLPVALWLRFRVFARLAKEYKVSDVRLSLFHFTPVVSARKLG